MNPMTAIGFLLAGASLWLARSQDPGPARLAAQACAAGVVLLGLLRVAGQLFGWSPDVDQLLLARRLEQAGSGTFGRMALLTAACLVFSGGALLLMDVETRRGLWPAPLVALPAGFLALLRLTGYAYDTGTFFRVAAYTSMAFNTALAFVLLFAGILAARPERGVMRVLTSETTAGASLRRVAPIGVVGLLLLGWLRLQGERAGWYDAEFGVTLMVVTTLCFFATLVSWKAHQLYDQELVRAQTERALRASEERFRALADTANDAIVSADSAGCITYLNRGAEKLFGHTAAEAIGRPLTLLMPERFHSAHGAGFRRYLATGEARVLGQTVELVALRRDGSELPIELSLAAWTNDQETSFTAIIRDISERKHAESELQRHQQELQEYIDSMSTMNARVAPDGTILLANLMAQQASGLSMEELLRTNFLDGQWWAFDPEVQARVRACFARACAGEPVNYDEKLFVFGTVVDISFGLVPVKDAEGRVLYIVAEGRDITSLKRSEEALASRTAQLEAANQGLESFSYSVSHDLRAPLRAIDGFSRILLAEHGQGFGAEAKRLLGVIRTNTTRMGQLIDDLLAFSRLSRKEIAATSIDMRALVAGVLEDLRRSGGEERAEVIIAALPACRGDSALLRQVWVNLIGNALKFSRTRSNPRVEIGGRAGPHESVYCVSDNGVGFDMAYADSLFGVFHRLHPNDEFEGTGVGLAIVKRVVERHGGRVWVEAALERGAAFYFALPAQE